MKSAIDAVEFLRGKIVSGDEIKQITIVHRLQEIAIASHNKCLKSTCWNIHRIWSTDWFGNKPVQVRLLIEKISSGNVNKS